MNIYLVLGYGIPKDITTDDNYRRYLGIVFNTIYSQAVDRPTEKIGIIFCGGRTDIVKPYQRTEAGEMVRFFKQLADRPECRTRTRGYQYFLEKKSLSTIENIIYSHEMIESKKLKSNLITIFCDATRAKRINQRARFIFGQQKIKVLAIDFDLSSNRYLEPEFLAQKEALGNKIEKWVLQDPENLKKYRRALIDKIKHFRQVGLDGHQAAIRQWWEQKINALTEQGFKVKLP